MILQMIVAMVATLAFAILFEAPKKEYIFCAVNGGLGWIVYLLFQRLGAGITIASLGATLFLTLAARVRHTQMSGHSVPGGRDIYSGAGRRNLLYGLLSSDE